MIADSSIELSIDDFQLIDVSEPFEVHLRLSAFTYDFDSTHLVAAGNATSSRIVAATDDMQWIFSDVSQAFTLDGNMLASDGVVTEAERGFSANTSMAFDLDSNQMTAKADLDSITISSPQQLYALVSPYAVPVEIVTGTIDADATFAWDADNSLEELVAEVALKIENLGGAYDEYFFSGLSTEFSTAVLPVMNSAQPMQLQIAHIDAGIPVQDAKAQLSFAQINPDAARTIELHSALASTWVDTLQYNLQR